MFLMSQKLKAEVNELEKQKKQIDKSKKCFS